MTGIDSQNRVDPRVDATGVSSLPSTNHGEAVTAGVGAAGAAAGTYEAGQHHDTDMTSTRIAHSVHTTSGSHDSNLGSKLDPRVDSDRDGHSGLGTSIQGDAL
jgi:hypothetical protein